jgi:hypothetical protein
MGHGRPVESLSRVPGRIGREMAFRRSRSHSSGDLSLLAVKSMGQSTSDSMSSAKLLQSLPLEDVFRWP